MFGASGSGLADVVQEGMEDTRVDLTQLEESGTGRSVPTTPQQISPTADQLGSVSVVDVEQIIHTMYCYSWTQSRDRCIHVRRDLDRVSNILCFRSLVDH